MEQCTYVFLNRHPENNLKPYPHRHPCVEIIYISGVCGWMHEDERKWRYAPNQIAVYQPGPQHWAVDDRACSGYHLCLGVTGGESALIPADVYPADKDLLLLVKLIENALSAPMTPDRKKVQLNLLSSLICLSLRDRVVQPKPAIAEHARVAKELIDTHFNEPLSLDTLASRIYLSGDHIRSLFKKEYGIGPIHYLLQKRIEHARGLLKNSDKKVYEIAGICGFNDPYYFSRIFKRISGLSPEQYRKSQ